MRALPELLRTDCGRGPLAGFAEERVGAYCGRTRRLNSPGKTTLGGSQVVILGVAGSSPVSHPAGGRPFSAFHHLRFVGALQPYCNPYIPSPLCNRAAKRVAPD